MDKYLRICILQICKEIKKKKKKNLRSVILNSFYFLYPVFFIDKKNFKIFLKNQWKKRRWKIGKGHVA
jgi:hypothetical protein